MCVECTQRHNMHMVVEALTVDVTVKLDWITTYPSVEARITNWIGGVCMKWTKAKVQIQNTIEVIISNICSHQWPWECHKSKVRYWIYLSTQQYCVLFEIRNQFSHIGYIAAAEQLIQQLTGASTINVSHCNITRICIQYACGVLWAAT